MDFWIRLLLFTGTGMISSFITSMFWIRKLNDQSSLNEMAMASVKSDRDGYQNLSIKWQRDYDAEVSALRKKITDLNASRTQDDEVFGKLAEKNKTLQDITRRAEQSLANARNKINDLQRRTALRSENVLADGLKHLARFVAANKWLMEKDDELADAVASVGEVAEAICDEGD